MVADAPPTAMTIENFVMAQRILMEEKLRSSPLKDDAKARIWSHFLGRLATDAARRSIGPVKRSARTMVMDIRHSVEPQVRDHILQRILAETGLTYADLVGDLQTKVARIVARGKVRSEAEYRNLRDHLDFVEGQGNADEAGQMVRTLDEFEIGLGRQKQEP